MNHENLIREAREHLSHLRRRVAESYDGHYEDMENRRNIEVVARLLGALEEVGGAQPLSLSEWERRLEAGK